MVLVMLRGALLRPMALTLEPRRPPVHTTWVRRPPHSGCWFPTPHPITPITSGDGPHMVTSTIPRSHGTADVMSVQFSGTFRIGRVGMSLLCHTALDDVNAILFQHTPNLLNIIHIHAGDTDTTVDITVTVLNDLELKRDTIQTKNDFPAQ